MVYPWLSASYLQVTRLVIESQLPHALLFHGAPSLGKQLLTKSLAELILCDQPQTKPNSPYRVDACGQCRSCTLIKADTHPDLYLFEQSESLISVEHIRAIIPWVQSHSARSGSKVILLPNIENMTLSAANALLKVLEEPPGKTCFLLTSSQLPALLPTIISRCQLWRINANTNNMGEQYLVARGYGTAQVKAALALSGGSPLIAEEYLQNDQLNLSDELIAVFGLWLNSQVSCEDLVAKINKQYLLFELLVADLIKVKMAVEPKHLSFPLQASHLQQISQALPLEALQRCYQNLLAFNQGLKISSGLNVALQLSAILLELKIA